MKKVMLFALLSATSLCFAEEKGSVSSGMDNYQKIINSDDFKKLPKPVQVAESLATAFDLQLVDELSKMLDDNIIYKSPLGENFKGKEVVLKKIQEYYSFNIKGEALDIPSHWTIEGDTVRWPALFSLDSWKAKGIPYLAVHISVKINNDSKIAEISGKFSAMSAQLVKEIKEKGSAATATK